MTSYTWSDTIIHLPLPRVKLLVGNNFFKIILECPFFYSLYLYYLNWLCICYTHKLLDLFLIKYCCFDCWFTLFFAPFCPCWYWTKNRIHNYKPIYFKNSIKHQINKSLGPNLTAFYRWNCKIAVESWNNQSFDTIGSNGLIHLNL